MPAHPAMPPIYIDFLNRLDIAELHMSDAEIIAAIEGALAALTEPCIIAGTPAALSLRVRPTDALLELHNMIFTELPEEVHLLPSRLLAASPETGERPWQPGCG